MARGSCIIVSADPKGTFDEAMITDTSLPGTIMEIVPGSVLQGSGRFQVRAAATGTTGKKAQHMVLLEDRGQGKGINDAYTANTQCRLYTPIGGEELNVLVADESGTGTGNKVAVGDNLALYSSGGVLCEAGSNTPDWKALESNTYHVSPALVWCRRL